MISILKKYLKIEYKNYHWKNMFKEINQFGCYIASG